MGVTGTTHKPTASTTTTPGGDNATPAAGAQKGYYYEVKAGDTLAAIAKAYRDQQHVKVTATQIQTANPGLNPNNMKVGQKIFIPDPNAK